jgi:hypothetical protein
MFTKAELTCGASGFLIILGMLIIATQTGLLGLPILIVGILGMVIATKLHESD